MLFSNCLSLSLSVLRNLDFCLPAKMKLFCVLTDSVYLGRTSSFLSKSRQSVLSQAYLVFISAGPPVWWCSVQFLCLSRQDLQCGGVLYNSCVYLGRTSSVVVFYTVLVFILAGPPVWWCSVQLCLSWQDLQCGGVLYSSCDYLGRTSSVVVFCTVLVFISAGRPV